MSSAVTCPYCRTEGIKLLGSCAVCSRTVCEHCGNVQYVGGERKVTHKECLHKHGDDFKMIKFVR